MNHILVIWSVLIAASSGYEIISCPSDDDQNSLYLPHQDCDKFWQCSNGVPYLHSCPGSLHFNRELNGCDWPETAGCRQDEEPSEGNSSKALDTTASTESGGSTLLSKSSMATTSRDPTQRPSEESTITPSDNSVTCPAEDGVKSVYLPHKDCNKFWQCFNGIPYLHSCPGGLYFNRILNVCDSPENTDCPKTDGISTEDSSDSIIEELTSSSLSILLSSEASSASTNPSSVPSESLDDISTISEASKNTARVTATPSRTTAVPTTIATTTATTISTTSSPTTVLEQNHSTNFNENENIDETEVATDICEKHPNKIEIFPFPGNCKKFVTCILGEATLMDCPKDQYFMPSQNACTPNVAVCG